MATVSEMLALAQATPDAKTRRRKALAGIAGQFLEGFIGGRERKLDRAIKLMEYQEKLEEAKRRKRNEEFVNNMLKAQGLVPLSEEEKEGVRTSGFDRIEGVQPEPRLNNTKGKIEKFLELDEMKYGKEGEISFTFKKPGEAKAGKGFKPEPKSLIEQRIRRAANEESLKEMNRNPDMAVLIDGLPFNEAILRIPPDIYRKHDRIERARITGNTGELEKLMRESAKEDDPLSLGESYELQFPGAGERRGPGALNRLLGFFGR